MHRGLGMSSEYMEKLYEIYPWPDNPYTSEGRARYVETLEDMEKIVSHQWFRKRLENKKQVSIIEFCSGYGVGGVGLARVLCEKYGLETSITLIDLRRKPLEVARRFSREELGYEAKTITHDVTEKIDLGRKYDIALLWGHSTPHFSPWDYIKLLANIHRSLKDKGIYFYDESDRTYTILVRTGYQYVLPELGGGKTVLTMHKKVDHVTGYIHRLAYNLDDQQRVDMKVYFWGLADSMAFTWMFFENIDFIPLKTNYVGVVIAIDPRTTVNVEDYLDKKPEVLRKIRSTP